MPSNTPAWAIPYPLGTDPISDGDDQIKNLATRVDNLIRAGKTAITTNGTGDASVTFTPAFPNALLTAVISDATDFAVTGALFIKYLAAYSDKTRISFRIYGTNGVALPGYNLTVSWIAIGS